MVDKPSGPTSHDVVSRVRRALKTRAVGHTGTLDPFATGLLVVLVGRATRLARFVAGEKTYVAIVKLGVSTTTDDLTGSELGASAVRRSGGSFSKEEIEQTLMGFLGPQRQRPPAFSAKKVDGERSYAKARRGEAAELAEVEIVIHEIELLGYEFPEVRFRARVSAGTYVRAIGRDLGERLGTGAHLTALRREAIGGLRVEQAVALDAVGPEWLKPPLDVLGHLPRLVVSELEARALGFGQSVSVTARLPACPPDRPIAAVRADDGLVAVGSVHDGTFKPDVVLEAAG